MGNLEELFGFTADDLTYNATQELSPAQRRELWLTPLWIAPFVVLFLFISILANTSNNSQLQTLPRILLLTVGMIFIWHFVKALIDTRSAVVKEEGKYLLHMEDDEGSKSYFLKIGMATFKLSKQQYHALDVPDQNSALRVYYTRMKHILAVEWVGGKPAISVDTRQAFSYSSDDLAGNLYGDLSPKQRFNFQWVVFKNILLYGLLAGVMALIALVLATIDTTMTVVMGLGSLLAIGGLVNKVHQAWQDTYQNELMQIEGTIRMGKIPTESSYKLRIEGLEFKITDQQFLALENGQRYRIYYMPASKHIVSINKLGNVTD